MITRLGLYGGPRGLYGSFAGKTVAIPVNAPGQTYTIPRDYLEYGINGDQAHYMALGRRLHYKVTR